MTEAVRRSVVVVAAIGAIAAVLAPPAPTGHAQIDALHRAGVAVVVTLAATRARRGALVASTVLVAVTADGWWIASGAAALVASAWLVVPNRRHRVVAAAAGAAVAVTAMHLDVGGFRGSSTVVGVTACLLVVGSAWRRIDAPLRRRWKLAALTAGVVVLASLAATAAMGLLARSDLVTAQQRTESGVAHLRQGRTGAAVAAFESAEEHFAAANRVLGSEVLLGTRLIPVVSQNVATVQDIVGVGERLAATAAANAAAVDYDSVRRPEGGIDLDVLESFRRPVERTAQELGEARAVVDAVPDRWLLPRIGSPFRRFAREVRGLAREADVALAAVQHGPALLGEAGPRRYLVLLGNPVESRDLGGHIGNWVELVVDDGRFDLGEVGGPLDLADRSGASLRDPSAVPPRLLEMRPAVFPQNWGSFPDLPTVAATSAAIFEGVTGRPVDGVAYADPEAFAAFVALSGPVQVPGLNGFAIDRSNAARFVTVDQYERFPDDQSADDALSEVIRTVFDRVTSGPLPGPRELADLFAPIVAERRFGMWSLHDGDVGLLRTVGLDGALRVPEGGDFVQVINRNANPSKIDRFLHRETSVVVGWNRSTGEVGSSVTVTARNDAPTSGLSATVIGNGLGLPVGTNVTDLAVVTPFSLLRVSVDGRRAPSRTQWNGHGWYHQVRLVLPPGGESVVRFELEGVVPAGPSYLLRVRGQPLVNDDVTAVRIVPSDGEAVSFRFRGPRARDLVVNPDA